MLLHKAYAKFQGSYAKAEVGTVDEALSTLVGGLGSRIAWDVENEPADERLFVQMALLKKEGHLLGARSITREGVPMLGIHPGACYAVIGVRKEEGHVLVKLRSPWSGEWEGEFSSGSRVWTPQLKEKLRYEDSADGVFWMPFRD